MYKKLLAVTLSSLISVSAVADNSGWYAGVGTGLMKADTEEAFGGDLNFTTIQALGGYQFNDYIAAEVRWGTSTGADEFTFFGLNAEADVNYYASAYVKGIYPITEGLSTYALLGKTRADIEVCLVGFECESESDNDTSYGLGVALEQDELSLNLEVVENFEDTKSVNIFVNMKF